MSRQKVVESYIRLNRLAIGARLKSERQRLGLTQGEVARYIGLKSKSAVKNYEKGQVPGPEILVRLAALFGQSVDWLLSGQESGEPTRMVAEPPGLYSGLGHIERQILSETKELLQNAGPEIKQHLRKEISLLKRAVSSSGGEK